MPQPVVGERVFAPGEFSHGERVLVTWAIMLFEQGVSLANAIVLLDEPDVHLHADVCSQALKRLREAIGPHGQMWIATHSVPLIADVGFDNLYFVRDGHIEIASRRADRVVNSLLGGDGARNALLEFLVDAERIAQIRFLLECLLEPGVASPATNDRQQAQFTSLVAKHLTKTETVRILEYGCGKARFAAALADWFAEHSTELRSRVEYHAFEDPAHHQASVAAACTRNVAALGVEPSLHMWNDISTLGKQYSERFDLVILCNTLHEIPPTEWPRVFLEIEMLLCESGALVVMEDLFPSLGELPNQTGFVILNETALQKLFGDTAAVTWSETHDGRVMVAEVPRRFLTVTSANRDAALMKVREQALEGIRVIRAKEPRDRTHHDGRAHAVWAMQFANATLALNETPPAGNVT